MSVEIIAVTKPRKFDSANDLITYCARVSNPSNQEKFDTAEKLLRYCISNQHWSIFEMVNVVVEINTTRDIARQILRHRSFSFQEFSQRYADPTKELGFVTREARLQDPKNRQKSIAIDPSFADDARWAEWIEKQEALIESVTDTYRWAIEAGIAKEQARVVLPEGLTMSRMYMSGTLRSWIHYCQLRMGNGTQKEHSDLAKEIWPLLCEEFEFLKELNETRT